MCNSEASAAGLSGNFQALLAQPSLAAVDRFDLDGMPWVRVDGIPIFEPLDPMGDTMLVGIGLHADGSVPPTEFRAWLGADSPFDLGTSDTTCAGWSMADPAAYSPLASGFAANWTAWASYTGSPECGMQFAVLCFEE